MSFDITVVTPSIPPRSWLLQRAVDSSTRQLHPPVAHVIAFDFQHEGVAKTRQRALDMVKTEWVSFLDDDDVWYTNHLSTHVKLLQERNADVAYSWFDGNTPFPQHRGKEMDYANPHHTTMTITVRTAFAQAIGFVDHAEANEAWPGEDWRFIQALIHRGAIFAGTGEITWHYNVHSGNTSGLPTRW